MAKTKNVRWLAASYSRLSREDAEDRAESNSISNQKTLIENYIKAADDITLVREYTDDGWSGSNFERPAFKEMMEALGNGEINCIIVKDLSRFGRNYIGVGRYIERIFPELGVRLVAINDNYDGAAEENYCDSLIVPIKNLINDNYCATTSAKTKAHLNIKRENGEFLSNFAPYGYAKDPQNKTHLIIDEEVSPIVKQIFEWRISGNSNETIANKLNELGIPSPHEYKVECGYKHTSPMKKGLHAKWRGRQIARMLEDEVYIGNLVQGKTYKPNFRSKRTVAKDKSEWTRSNGTHEPIIDEHTFRLAADLATRDMRSVAVGGPTYLLSGFIFCADCGDTLCLVSQKARGKQYRYYKCNAHRLDKNVCSTHTMKAEDLEASVSRSILNSIHAAADATKAEGLFNQFEAGSDKMRVLTKRRDAAIAEGERCNSMSARLYNDFRKKLINQEELTEFRAEYEKQAQRCEEQVSKLDAEIAQLESLQASKPWEEALTRWQNATVLSREMLVELVDRIEVDENRVIKITYRFQDMFKTNAGDVR